MGPRRGHFDRILWTWQFLGYALNNEDLTRKEFLQATRIPARLAFRYFIQKSSLPIKVSATRIWVIIL